MAKVEARVVNTYEFECMGFKKNGERIIPEQIAPKVFVVISAREGEYNYVDLANSCYHCKQVGDKGGPKYCIPPALEGVPTAQLAECPYIKRIHI